jgi:DNA-binding CsgD family transcriptional regulator
LDKNRINIAILEPSQIVFEGLAGVLMKSQHQYAVSRIHDIEELFTTVDEMVIDIALINPSVIQNKAGILLKLKKKCPALTVIGIVYSFYKTELISQFNTWFSVTDSVNSIIQKLENIQNRSNDKGQSNEDLTEREVEVLTYLTKGLSNKEIADKLNISIHTVISHRKNLSEKTGIKSLPGLTIYAISKNIIPLNDTNH